MTSWDIVRSLRQSRHHYGPDHLRRRGLHTFFIPAGAYLLCADAPGYQNVAQQVVAKPRAPGDDNLQDVVLYLERK